MSAVRHGDAAFSVGGGDAPRSAVAPQTYHAFFGAGPTLVSSVHVETKTHVSSEPACV